MKKNKIILICLMILSIVITGVSFLFLNDTIPTHFGVDGKPDQYGSKYFMLLFPLVLNIIGGIMLIISKYMKLSDNYKKYMLLTGIILALVINGLSIAFVIYAGTYVEETPAFDMSKVMMLIMGTMLVILSNFMPKIEKNRTLGLKTKWSMYNEVTWQKSHRFVGYVGMIGGLIVLVSGLFFQEIVNFIILMVVVFGIVISSSIASYIYYKKEKELGN